MSTNNANQQQPTSKQNDSSAVVSKVTDTHKILYPRVAKSFPKKDQAITFSAIEHTKIKEYLLSVAPLVGAKCIIAASRISNQGICMYLDSKKTVDSFIDQHIGITINNQFLTAKRLVEPPKK